MKLVPLGDRVVLKQLEAEETTKSGIVLPGQTKEKPQQAEIIAVGPGGIDVYKRQPLAAARRILCSIVFGESVKWLHNSCRVVFVTSSFSSIKYLSLIHI